jgi:putative transposase
VPREYGSGKTLHRYFQRWTRARVFKKLWKSGLEEYAEVQGIDWKWHAADGPITKAPLGGQATGANPTDRGQCGTKRSVLVETKGVPIVLEVGPAQRHDVRRNPLIRMPLLPIFLSPGALSPRLFKQAV